MALWFAGAGVFSAPGGGSRLPRRPQPLRPRAAIARARTAHLVRTWVGKRDLQVARSIEAKAALRELLRLVGSVCVRSPLALSALTISISRPLPRPLARPTLPTGGSVMGANDLKTAITGAKRLPIPSGVRGGGRAISLVRRRLMAGGGFDEEAFSSPRPPEITPRPFAAPLSPFWPPLSRASRSSAWPAPAHWMARCRRSWCGCARISPPPAPRRRPR